MIVHVSSWRVPLNDIPEYCHICDFAPCTYRELQPDVIRTSRNFAPNLHIFLFWTTLKDEDIRTKFLVHNIDQLPVYLLDAVEG